MNIIGNVFVKDNKYKLKGDFHRNYPSVPIRNADDGWKLMGVTNPRELTHIHMYGGEAPFFEGLGQGRLLATRCDNRDCEHKGTTYQPYRIHCPDCLGRNAEWDMTDIARNTAKIHTFMVCERSGAFNVLSKPIKFINIEFEGLDTILMSYLSAGNPEFGMRVVPIFKKQDPTCTILDLSWVTEGVPAKALPAGFSY